MSDQKKHRDDLQAELKVNNLSPIWRQSEAIDGGNVPDADNKLGNIIQELHYVGDSDELDGLRDFA